MKRIIPFLIVVAALFAVPALSQGTGDSLSQEVERLQDQVEALTAQGAEQGKQLATLAKRIEAQQAEAKNLLQALKRADAGGFAMAAPNVAARETLLKGLMGFANVAAGNERDAPVEAPAEE